MNEITVSVTALSEYVSRSGDLAGASYQGVSGIEGTRLHKRVFADLRKQYGDDIGTEYYLTAAFEDKELRINVRGRADALIVRKNLPPHLIEIKSVNSVKNRYDLLERPEHLTQLKLYGAMYLMDNEDIFDVKLTLRYVSITTLEAFEKTFDLSYEEALSYFNKTCEEYSEFALSLLNYKYNLYKSAAALKFPYPEIRPGQAEFMKTALVSLCSKEAMFVEAPTGTGKTISTLYPAVKGLLKGKYHKIFYLTAKSATREVALKAVNDMRKKGLIIRSVLLAPKEYMCPYADHCDPKYCTRAKQYYTKLNPALKEILLYDNITPDLAIKIADKHTICAHQFILEAMNYCTVVIGDYNHGFSPRVSLIDSEEDDGNAVLVDEAHNMVDRGREMFSASFGTELLDRMINDFKGKNAKIEAHLQRLSQYFAVINQCMATKQSCFKMNEDADQSKILMTDNFEGVRMPPRKLYSIMWYLLFNLQPFLDSMEHGIPRETAMEFFFELRFFVTVLEQYYDDSYITCVTREKGQITITLDCLDSSAKFDKLIKDKMSVIFFSATLSPFEYYRNVFIGKDPDYTRELRLASPFPPENLEIILETEISTSYVNRNFTADDLTGRICEELSDRTGNYMCFFPSFEYMNMIYPKIKEEFEKQTSLDGTVRDIVLQTPEMNKEQKDGFLRNFSAPASGLLLGMAVLGGHFGEGIDLVGDMLSGVIIVGVGIPKVTPERQILSNYYGERFGDGFAFAYRFPGWEKVLQAVGRVIRTESDTGFALLIDERLKKPEYMMLFPDHWQL